MSETIQINKRGSMTLPKLLRKKLGIVNGGVLIAEATSEGVILKPAMAFPIEIYTDERISEFEREESKLKQHLIKRADRNARVP